MAPQGITSLLVGELRFRSDRGAFVYLCRRGRLSPFKATDVVRLRPLLRFAGVVDAATSRTAKRRGAFGAALGPREREVARLASRGLQTKEIASILGTRATTVRNQMSAICRKLDVANRTELALALSGGASEPVAHRTLGARERLVARLTSGGLATSEVAAVLGTSLATVRNQLTSIYRKLEVSNRTELGFILSGGGFDA